MDSTPNTSSANQCSSVFLITSNGRKLWLPIPSNSPRDPLNWNCTRRTNTLGSLFIFTTIALVQMQGTSLLLPELEKVYKAEQMVPFRLDILSSIPSVFMGLGAFLWIPLSVAIGRRPVLRFCTILLTASTLWAGFSQTFYQHLIARCLQGLAISVCSSTVFLMIIDLTFIHMRPHTLAAFLSLCSVLSNILLTMTPSLVSLGGTWRAFYWFWSGPCIVAFGHALFLCPETYFQRPAVAFDGHILVQGPTETIKVYENWDETPGGKPLPDPPESWWRTAVGDLTKKGGRKGMWACYFQIGLCLINPLMIGVTLLNGFILGGLVSITETSVELLHGPPYNLQLRSLILIRVAAAIGALIAWPVSGIRIATIRDVLAKRNRGVHEPEHYVPSFILPVLTGSASLLLYGLSGSHHWHSTWIFTFIGLNYFSIISLATSSTLWVTEAFPQWAAAALVSVGGGSYAVSFALSFAIGPWIKSQGFAGAKGQIGGLVLGAGCVAIPVAFWGKRWRERIHCKWGASEAGALRPL